MDDTTVEILVGIKYIYRKGPLTKIISRNTGSRKEDKSFLCAFQKNLRLLDFSKCSITMVGKEYLQEYFNRQCRIVLYGWCIKYDLIPDNIKTVGNNRVELKYNSLPVKFSSNRICYRLSDARFSYSGWTSKAQNWSFQGVVELSYG